MKVKDIMTKGVFTVDENLSVYEIAEIMAKYDISGVAVLGDEGSLEGTISERDIMKAIAEEKDLDKIRAKDIMTPCVITVDAEMNIEEVVRIMHKENIHRLFVCVDEKITPARVGPKYRIKPIGIISTSDLVRELARGRLNADISRQKN